MGNFRFYSRIGDRMSGKPILICDTREKKPLSIGRGKLYEDIINGKLDTGDYSIVGLEDHLCIERKGEVSEFAQNVFQERFVREMERMTMYKYSFILFEFDMDDLLYFPKNLPVRVQKNIHYNGKLVLKKMIEFQIRYPKIHFIFCGDNTIEVLNSICKRVVDIEWNA